MDSMISGLFSFDGYGCRKVKPGTEGGRGLVGPGHREGGSGLAGGWTGVIHLLKS